MEKFPFSSFSSPISSPLLLRNLLTSLFTSADNSLLSLSHNHKLLHLLRHLIAAAFLFLLRLLFPAPVHEDFSNNSSSQYNSNKLPDRKYPSREDSAIARALSHLLSIVNDVPVSSRKYQTVRSLAEKIIEENLSEGSEILRRVNCTTLSTAFNKTLNQLESAVLNRDKNRTDSSGGLADNENNDFKVNRVLRAVQYCGDVVWCGFLGKGNGDFVGAELSAEKLAAEVLWLAEKMAACGCVEEAVEKWASTTRLAWLALSSEPRLQGSLVKISAFLFKHARDLGQQEEEESKKEHHRQTKMKMLISWLPLLCRASNGTDAPIMSISERTELERILEELIEMLEQEDEQEKVLSLWLHHFTHCPSSDWPNLHACYVRWCTASRKLLLIR